MSAKIILLVLAQTLLSKFALSQCIGSNPAALSGVEGVFGSCYNKISSSSIPSAGITVVTDNLAINGALEVIGSLPFLGTVRLEGVVPNSGQAAVHYACDNGNGNVGISEAGVGTGFGYDGYSGQSLMYCRS